ncbi:hypothetical protein VZT92_016934 [Zoarces viviparus]|uniref:Uncharacterized protein n=1 Tax=Zoarces viviparus TaxID=48416 RepID=A0AAW1EQK2_ZOAVI
MRRHFGSLDETTDAAVLPPATLLTKLFKCNICVITFLFHLSSYRFSHTSDLRVVQSSSLFSCTVCGLVHTLFTGDSFGEASADKQGTPLLT